MNVNMHADNSRGERHVCWPRMGEWDLKCMRFPCTLQSLKHDIAAANWYSDDYEMTPFSHICD